MVAHKTESFHRHEQGAVMSTAVGTEGAHAVVDWFGAGFGELHSLLQALHAQDSKLSGTVDLHFGEGVAARAFGRHMARKLGMPDTAGQHRLTVTIRHDAKTLSWNRCFDDTHELRSTFLPVGHWPEGHWVEKTGALELALAVDAIDGGWYWRVMRASLRGMRIPLWMIPRSTAYKRIEDGKYRFHVAFAVPVLGEVIRYSGVLEPAR
jgi:hypothetical protein